MTTAGRPERAQRPWLWSGKYVSVAPLRNDEEEPVTVEVFSSGAPVIERHVKPAKCLDLHQWHHDRYIWPGWAPKLEEQLVDARSPLEDVHDYWEAATTRLRDGARWMASVIGATLAAMVATSPFAQDHKHHLTWASVTLGFGGLSLLIVTLVLILHVLLPHSVSFNDIRNAKDPKSPLGRLKATIVNEPDLYLPCGIFALEGLQQAIKIEELTLMALADASHHEKAAEWQALIQEAEVGRAARLRELRRATASIALIGEHYKLRSYSRTATILGPIFAALGAMATISSVILTYS
jgi:hypothetical protein